jgi:hypothetical protein
MKVALRILVFALLVLAACQQPQARAPEHAQVIAPEPSPQEQPQPEPVAEPPQEVPDVPPAQMPAEAASAQREAMFGGTRYDGSKVITEYDVLCDLEARKLTFRFRNKETRTWQLDGELPLSPPAGLVGVYLTINQYPVNQNHEYYIDGVKQFGPGAKLSENCGGVATLAPEEEAVCTLQPVPLRDQFYFGGVNEILINVPGAAEDGRVEFTCA